ncbi:MAG: PilZ domain-containing protein [Candidatus Omnitrophica bacterium]|nr:PilZ domain-containing protein [Candidatus Omnitrophota bacterium]
MMAIKPIMHERRKFPRANISFPVECNPLTSNTYFYTVSKDMSPSGIKILSNTFLSKDALFKVSINFIDKVMQLKAKVAWCSQTRTPDTFHTGLQFVEVNSEEQNSLNRFFSKITPSVPSNDSPSA